MRACLRTIGWTLVLRGALGLALIATAEVALAEDKP